MEGPVKNPRGEIGKTSDAELVRRLLIEGYGYAPDLIYEIRGRYHKVYAWKPCPFKVKNSERRGIYFGRIESDGIRLSIEGSFLVGPRATKNVVELDDEGALQYLSGEDIEILDKNLHGWVILRWGYYYLGTGKAVNGRIHSYVPKERRLRLDD